MWKKLILTFLLVLLMTCCTKDGETIYLLIPGEGKKKV